MDRQSRIRHYHYVGPAEIAARAHGRPGGAVITSAAGLHAWIGGAGIMVATFVIDTQGRLRLAERHSEHIACAGGEPVLSAGEMFVRRAGRAALVEEASNQSTGYCPEPESWPAVAAALDRAGVAHPGRFTTAVVFRRCGACGQRNIVKDDWYRCAVCAAELPCAWNFECPNGSASPSESSGVQ